MRTFVEGTIRRVGTVWCLLDATPGQRILVRHEIETSHTQRTHGLPRARRCGGVQMVGRRRGCVAARDHAARSTGALHSRYFDENTQRAPAQAARLRFSHARRSFGDIVARRVSSHTHRRKTRERDRATARSAGRTLRDIVRIRIHGDNAGWPKRRLGCVVDFDRRANGARGKVV